jgi:NAD(P)-dependent dehydrogenase (short-subunit alcohol dehydrogenase family)
MGLFKDKTGLVTGGSSGIGRATAIAFAREGANVVIADLEAARTAADEVVAEIVAQGGQAVFVPTDVSSARDVENLVAETVRTFGALDFAFNNAGVHTAGFTDAIEEREFDRVMAVDTKGVWLCLKYEIAHMKRHGGGAIVNAASVAGLVGTPQAAAYVAAKHAVVGLTKAAAGEFANMGIRINAVAPGAIATPMVLQLPSQTQHSLMEPQPLQRLGRPEEVAEAVLWLCSSKSSFVLGTTLSVDGGATLNAQSYSAENSPSF